jgi:hypothetical protein
MTMTSAVVHVEVVQHRLSTEKREVIRERVLRVLRAACGAPNWVAALGATRVRGNIFAVADLDAVDAVLRTNIERITLETTAALSPATVFAVHVYQLNTDGVGGGPVEDDDGSPDGDASSSPACTIWELPSSAFDGVWESLHFATGVKDELLAYVETALALGDRGVSRHLVSWNGLVLLHGPPGTGKTTLAQALAHKLAVRHVGAPGRYASAELVSVNSHSLFSRWFSESGKLVARMFARIRELAEDESVLVVVLVDEAESLSCARRTAVAGGEPSDAIRTVNALLTQLDSLRTLRNVVTVATSNITEAIDPAFVDRADLKLYVPLPGPEARFEILASAIEELARVGIVVADDPTSGGRPAVLDHKLMAEVCALSEGMSGRALRKLPFLALSLFLPTGIAQHPLSRFFTALSQAASREAQSRSQIQTR